MQEALAKVNACAHSPGISVPDGGAVPSREDGIAGGGNGMLTVQPYFRAGQQKRGLTLSRHDVLLTPSPSVPPHHALAAGSG